MKKGVSSFLQIRSLKTVENSPSGSISTRDNVRDGNICHMHYCHMMKKYNAASSNDMMKK